MCSSLGQQYSDRLLFANDDDELMKTSFAITEANLQYRNAMGRIHTHTNTICIQTVRIRQTTAVRMYVRMDKVIVIAGNAYVAVCLTTVRIYMTRIGVDIGVLVVIIGDRITTIVCIVLKIVSGQRSLIFNLIEKIEKIIHYPGANASMRYRRIGCVELIDILRFMPHLVYSPDRKVLSFTYSVNGDEFLVIVVVARPRRQPSSMCSFVRCLSFHFSLIHTLTDT